MTYKKAAPHIARASMVEDYKKDNESIALVSQWYYDFTGDDENHLIGIYRNQNLFTSAKEFAQTHKDNPNVLYTMFNILISRVNRPMDFSMYFVANFPNAFSFNKNNLVDYVVSNIRDENTREALIYASINVFDEDDLDNIKTKAKRFNLNVSLDPIIKKLESDAETKEIAAYIENTNTECSKKMRL